jgi:hypothetical protein
MLGTVTFVLVVTVFMVGTDTLNLAPFFSCMLQNTVYFNKMIITNIQVNNKDFRIYSFITTRRMEKCVKFKSQLCDSLRDTWENLLKLKTR